MRRSINWYKEREQFDIRDSEVHFTGYTEMDISSYGVRKLQQLMKIFKNMNDEQGRIIVNIKMLEHWVEVISDKTFGTKMKMLIFILSTLDVKYSQFVAL